MSNPEFLLASNQTPAQVHDDNQPQKSNDYDERAKAQKEEIRKRRVDYVIKDLPIY